MSEKLTGSQLFESREIQKNIDLLVEKTLQMNSSINAPAPAREEFLKSSKQHIDDTGVNRGRPLFYPYIGSGAGNGSLC